jgi:hypothetical protein
MTNLKLINEINNDNFQPELFDGFIVQDINFIKYFNFDKDSIDRVFNRINAFLLVNGYDALDFANNWSEDGISNNFMCAYGNPYVYEHIGPNIVLLIYRNIN